MMEPKIVFVMPVLFLASCFGFAGISSTLTCPVTGEP